MTRRMSCSMTVPAVVAREKTVTRRHVDTWAVLRPGDRLVLIEKGMGLKRGERQRVLAEVEVVDVRLEPLALSILPGELQREGLSELSHPEFVDLWCRSHGYGHVTNGLERLGIVCRRIEWRYLDGVESSVGVGEG